MRKFTFAFKDEDGNGMTPNSIAWTLTDESGTVIHERDDVEVTPDTSVDVVLNGDDTALQEGEIYLGKRIFILKIKYNSDAGTGLEAYKDIRFVVDNLVDVP